MAKIVKAIKKMSWSILDFSKGSSNPMGGLSQTKGLGLGPLYLIPQSKNNFCLCRQEQIPFVWKIYDPSADNSNLHSFLKIFYQHLFIDLRINEF